MTPILLRIKVIQFHVIVLVLADNLVKVMVILGSDFVHLVEKEVCEEIPFLGGEGVSSVVSRNRVVCPLLFKFRAKLFNLVH